MGILNKAKGKEKGDEVRGAEESEIRVGDMVLLKNVMFPNKLTNSFDPEEYEVKQRNENGVMKTANQILSRVCQIDADAGKHWRDVVT